MKPLVKVYWLRVALGIIAAFLCAVYGILTGTISNSIFTFNILMNSITIALAIYLISYYIIKRKFMLKVEKPSKLATTGIGIYFIAWLVFWVLLYTIIAVT